MRQVNPKTERKQVKIIDKTMIHCEKNNCLRKNLQSPSFHESWDRQLPSMNPNSHTDRPKAGILKNKETKYVFKKLKKEKSRNKLVV